MKEKLDIKLIKIIEKDFKIHKKFSPSKLWLKLSKEQISNKKTNKLKDNFLYHWEGFGKNNITKKSIFFYKDFLKKVDNFSILKKLFNKNRLTKYAKKLTVSDLGFLIDISIINNFIKKNRKTIYVLEVGGGYGKFVKIFHTLHKSQKIKYLFIEGSFSSLYFSYKYLSKYLDKKKVGFYYHDKNATFNKYDIIIAPPWYKIDKNKKFDVAINIQSMQEMDQRHVDYYLKLFNKYLSNLGIIYLSNRKDHYFRGRYKVPKNWKLLIKTESPRSFIRDFPIEIYEKQKSIINNRVNNLIASLYEYRLMAKNWNILTKAKKRKFKLY